MARLGALAPALLVAAAIGCGSSEQTSTERSRQTTTYDHSTGWSWTYPESWRLQTFDELEGTVRVRGALVSSIDRTYRRPAGDAIAWDLRDLPSRVACRELATSRPAGGQ